MLTRLTGVAILLIAAIAWPMAALAADPAVETQQNPAVVYLVLTMLFVALTSGILFASPLRGKLIPSTAEPARRPRPVTPARIAAPPINAAPSPASEMQPPTYPPQAAAGPAQLGQVPWSTTDPQSIGPWTHGRRGPQG
jgi:hypothetical protein